MLYKADILAICPVAKAAIVDAMVDEGYKGAWERFGWATPRKAMAGVIAVAV